MSYFTAKELVDKSTYLMYGERALNLFNLIILKRLNKIREKFGRPIIVNNHKMNLQYCGLRSLDCPIGAKRSIHKQGRAFDLHAKDIASLRGLLYLLRGAPKTFFIERLENPKITLPRNYIHIEISENKSSGELIVFDP